MTVDNQDMQVTLMVMFDPDQVDLAQFGGEVRQLLGELLNQIQLEVGRTEAGSPLLTVSGTLQTVDKCHTLIDETYFRRLNRRHFLLKDTAGDEFRRQAYPILADIEQELRAFINQCLIEVLGFAWWTTLGQIPFPGLELGSPTYNPLGNTTFDGLIHIVTAEVAEWGPERALSAADLTALLAGSGSIDELRANLQRKTIKFSFWNDVFAKYLVDKKKWEELEKELEFVIRTRNKVMHHKPIRLGELEALNKKRELIINAISERIELSDAERAEIRQRSIGLRDIYAKIVRETIAPSKGDLLQQQAYTANTVDELLSVLTQLTPGAELGELDTRAIYQLRSTVFSRLKELTEADFGRAQQLIRDLLIPECLQDIPEARIELSRIRDCLVDWINQYSRTETELLQGEIIGHLISALDSQAPIGACRTVAHIGFRASEIEAALWRIVNARDDETGDIALSTLTTLVITGDARARAVEQIHQRLAGRFNHSLVWAVARLGDQASITVILNNWLQADQRAAKGVDAPLAFTAIREILGQHPSDAALHDMTWAELVQLVEPSAGRSFWDFDIGHVHDTSDSPHVVPTLLNWLHLAAQHTQNPPWTRYIIGQRLNKCVRPRQLEGWSIPVPDEVRGLLQQDACQNTGHDVFVSTGESMTKGQAWLTLLAMGNADILNWFDPAAMGETSRFEQAKVMNHLASFSITPLPEQAVTWITEEYDGAQDGTDAREFSRRMAAVQLARSSATPQAFDVLLHFGYTHGGQVIRQSIDALTEVALWLLKKSEITILDRLVQAGVSSDLAHQRTAALYAIERIAAFDQQAILPHAEHLFERVRDAGIAPLERGLLIEAIGHLSDWALPEYLKDDLVRWTRDPNERIAQSSLVALATHGHLEEHPEVLTEVLGLAQAGVNWDVDAARQSPEWASEIIGRLYAGSPSTFAPAVMSTLTEAGWKEVIGLFEDLAQAHSVPGQVPLPKSIEDALVDRVIRKQTLTYSELDLFGVLRDMAPARLLAQPWEMHINSWSADAKEALARALGQANFPELQSSALALRLQPLMLDPMYVVRRAAFRALGIQSSPTLYAICRDWISSEDSELLIRVTEAYVWLRPQSDGISESEVAQMHNLLVTHPDSRIRASARKGWYERRTRYWAQAYLARVFAVVGESNQEVLATWRFGSALSQIGDDECLQTIERHANKSHLSPSVRFWLGQVHKEMVKQWRTTTQKWPQPWQSLTGTVEQGSGTLRVDSSKLVDVKYSVWQRPRSPNQRILSWGGVLSCDDPWVLLNAKQGVLTLADGRRGEILYSHVIGGSATFLGNGAYPTQMPVAM